MIIHKLEDLNVWKEARLLCKWIYIITGSFPKSENFNIIKHLRESARGTASNIGEGFGRYFYKENLRFYGIARGCLNEVKSDLYLSFDIGYINEEALNKFINQVDKVEALINGLIRNVIKRMQVEKQNNKK